ncbi:MAG: hypothetical protein ACRDV9_06940, partial [Acidimicrobiia bacterium]
MLRGVWWRELEVLLVACSGLRWGEHAALSAARTAGVDDSHRLLGSSGAGRLEKVVEVMNAPQPLAARPGGS